MDRHVHPTRRGTHRLTLARNGNVPEFRLHPLGERWKSIPMGIDITIYSEQRVGAIPGCALKVVSRTAARHGKGWPWFEHSQCRQSTQQIVGLRAKTVSPSSAPAIVVEVKDFTPNAKHDGPQERILHIR